LQGNAARLAITFVALLAFTLQSFVTQVHIHKLTSGNIAAAQLDTGKFSAGNQKPGKSPARDDPAIAPLPGNPARRALRRANACGMDAAKRRNIHRSNRHRHRDDRTGVFAQLEKPRTAKPSNSPARNDWTASGHGFDPCARHVRP